jgi:hypothetical protein
VNNHLNHSPGLLDAPRSPVEAEQGIEQLQETLRRSEATQLYQTLRQRVRDLVQLTTPVGSTVLVISKGDEELLDIPGRRGWHFPRAVNGLFAGCYPGDSDEAIEHLRKLRSRGAQYLVIPSTSFWWLEFYAGFVSYLQEKHRLSTFQEDVCVVYRLSPGRRRSNNQGAVDRSVHRAGAGARGGET